MAPPGGARDQEPADPDPALCRAPVARARRPRRAAQPGARGLRVDDPRAGAAAPADLGRVLLLCLVADRAARSGRPSTARRRSGRSVPHRARGPIAIDNRAAGPLPLVLVDPTLLTRALGEHRRERAPRDAGRGAPDHRHRARAGRRCSQRHRHRPRAWIPTRCRGCSSRNSRPRRPARGSACRSRDAISS